MEFSHIVDAMLSVFMTYYEASEGKMSSEVYDRAVFMVSIGVPVVLFIAVVAAYFFCMVCVCNLARGYRK